MTVKYLIVGQGIAGTLLALELERRGESFVIIDAAHQHSSSLVAAGIVNPITGKRFVKSWQIDDLLPQLAEMYGAAEQKLGIKIWHKMPILRVLRNAEQENNWLARAGWDSWRGYLGAANVDISSHFAGVFGVANILQGGKIDMQLLLRKAKNYFITTQKIIHNTFIYNDLDINNNKYTIDNTSIKFDKIVFCEGWQLAQNPYFNYLPLQPSRGEALLVEIDAAYPFEGYLVKNDLLFVPASNNPEYPKIAENKALYWIGATNGFNQSSPDPSPEGYLELTQKLAAAYTQPYKIVSHVAAFRPATRDRRPFVGVHPKHDNMLVINGLGTKGASLAPAMVNALLAHLYDGTPIPSEIDIARYH